MSDLLEFQGISGHPNFGHFRRNGSFSTPTGDFTQDPLTPNPSPFRQQGIQLLLRTS